jgi:hypothetical protein
MALWTIHGLFRDFRILKQQLLVTQQPQPKAPRKDEGRRSREESIRYCGFVCPEVYVRRDEEEATQEFAGMFQYRVAPAVTDSE